MILRVLWWLESVVYVPHTWVTFVTLLILLPMLIFRASRPWGASALYYASIYWGVLLWVQSCIYVLGALGPVWFIVGVLLAGIGVVPIAWVGTLVHGDWTNWKWLSLDLVWVFGTRLLAIRCCMERAKRA